MKTCKNCIHSGVCGQYLLPWERDSVEEHCESFKDKSKFIELPFSKDGYCTFGKKLFRVFGVLANGDNDFYVNIYKVDKADEVFELLTSRAVTFISDGEAKKIWEELNNDNVIK